MNEEGSREDTGDSSAPDRDGDTRAERLLRPFVDEQMLWPVGLVIMAHAVAFMTPVVVMGVRDRRPMFLVALFALVGMSVFRIGEDVRRGRIGVISGALIGLWTVTAATAWASAHYGLF